MTVLQELQTHFRTSYPPETVTAHTPDLQRQDEQYIGHFAGLELHSHFQPLFHSAQLQVFAYEALLRPRQPGQSAFLPPYLAFERAQGTQDAVCLDRLCRVVHALNYVRQQPRSSLLFLNVSTQHLRAVTHRYGETFEQLLRLCGLRPQQVVLEISEVSVQSLSLLQTAVQDWHSRGFQIALDDFGCQHSNFDRLWQLTPDIVKLDRGLIQQAAHNPRAAIILPKLIAMVHDLGASVVCEGVETATQHQQCLDAGADLLQGYFYARPAAQLQAAAAVPHTAHAMQA